MRCFSLEFPLRTMRENEPFHLLLPIIRTIFLSLQAYFSEAPASSPGRTHLYVVQQLRPRAPPLIFHLFSSLHIRSSTRARGGEHRCATDRRSCCRSRTPDVWMKWTAAASSARPTQTRSSPPVGGGKRGGRVVGGEV